MLSHLRPDWKNGVACKKCVLNVCITCVLQKALNFGTNPISSLLALELFVLQVL